MDTLNDEVEGTGSEEIAGAEKTCETGCDCNTVSSNGRARWVLGLVILAVTAALVGRAMVKGRGSVSGSSEGGCGASAESGCCP